MTTSGRATADAAVWSLRVAALAAVVCCVVLVTAPEVGAELLAQAAESGQEVADDGTRPLRLLAVLMGLLALLLGVFTRWYWKATVPPARRGYLPDSETTPMA